MIDPNLISTIGGTRQAAAAKAKRQQEEEEEMTGYPEDKPAEKWEYKIIRSGMGAFRHRDRLRQVIEEEARAGWELVEKFDNNRVRLRRPMAARDNDRLLDVDPYRTWIGVSDAGLVVRVLLGSALVGTAVLLIFLLLRR